MSYLTLKTKIQQLIHKVEESRLIWGNNLADPNEIIQNYYIKSSAGGIEEAWNNWSITKYIALEQGKVYSVIPSGIYEELEYTGFYDEDKNFIRRVRMTDFVTDVANKMICLTPPAGAKYVRFSAETKDIQNCQVCEIYMQTTVEA